MRIILTFVLSYFVIASVFAQKTNFLLEDSFKDYIPISAIEYDGAILIADSVGVFKSLTARELATDKVRLSKFLNDFSVYVTIEKADVSGKISYAVASANVEKGNYTVIVDFVKCNTINLMLGDGTCGGFGKVGVGLRLRASIETKKAGLNIGNLFGLAQEAQKGKVSGTLSFDVIGINSKDILNLIPLPTEISQASIVNALQAMASIKSKIEDENTNLYPKLLAIKLTNGRGCGIDSVIEKVNVDQDIKKQQQFQQQKPRSTGQRQEQIQQQADE